MKSCHKALVIIVFTQQTLFSFGQSVESVPRQWINSLLFSIRNDFARPPVHARNLHHVSMAMYDAWAVYEPGTETAFLNKSFGGFQAQFDGVQPIYDSVSRVISQEMAISFACYRLIKHRFANAPGAFFIYQHIDSVMNSMGYDIGITSVDYHVDGPAAMGNYITQQIILYGLQDGSNEVANYVYQYYTPANPPIPVEQPGNPTMVDPHRWQPISLTNPVDQAGNPLPSTPIHLGPEWGNVTPFALNEINASYHVRDGDTYRVYYDPGPPPLLDTNNQAGLEDFFKWNFVLVSIWQGHEDPNDPTVWDISPNSMGNITSYPQNWSEYESFYNLYDGGDPGTGYSVNPITGMPYTPQNVKRADYARVLAEFWADGIDSETPPGHWFDIYNHISEHPLYETKWKGEGPDLTQLEYDVKAYLTLGGAMHDAAITAWSIKGWYDSPRPVSMIRYMADKGQSTDNMASNYHPAGLPLIPGHIETVEIGDPLAGASNEHVGKIKLYTWKGHEFISDPETEYAGVGWILAENWWPYQRPSFVSPPFAGYISGHSTYSSAAAEVLSFITGSPYFPGGMSEFVAEQNEFLEFEEGPSQTIVLQWATYKDAADQCSLSRIWGGIHPPIDDIPGRIIGVDVGVDGSEKADSIVSISKPTVIALNASTSLINSFSSGSQLVITAQYDSLMNTTILPQITFPVHDPSSVLTFNSGSWLNSNTVEYIFDILSASTELDHVFIKIDSAFSLSGRIQQKTTFNPVFLIDTKLPEVDLLTQNYYTINSGMNGAQLVLNVHFTEDCQSLPLSFSHNPLNPANYELNDTPSSAWVSASHYSAVVDINLLDPTIQIVDIYLNDVFDLAGNPILVNSIAAQVFIDTDLPHVVSWSDNYDTINSLELGSGEYQITMAFDKQMNVSALPAIHFVDDVWNSVDVPLVVNPNLSEWISSNDLLLSFDIIDLPNVELENLSLVIDEVLDISSNVGLNEVLYLNLAIDNIRPTVLSSQPMHLLVDLPVYLNDETFIDVLFSEEMSHEQIPIVECHQNELVIADPSYNPFNSYWLDNYTYRAHFTLPNTDFQLNDVGVKVSFAYDNFGNPQFEFISNGLMDIDYMLNSAGFSEKELDIVLYPNPIQIGQELKIKSNSRKFESISILDLTGRTIYSDEITEHSETILISLESNHFSAGVYRVILEGELDVIEGKIVIAD
jgi:hypothetical protein